MIPLKLSSRSGPLHSGAQDDEGIDLERFGMSRHCVASRSPSSLLIPSPMWDILAEGQQWALQGTSAGES
jgi:hypothetical protein